MHVDGMIDAPNHAVPRLENLVRSLRFVKREGGSDTRIDRSLTMALDQVTKILVDVVPEF